MTMFGSQWLANPGAANPKLIDVLTDNSLTTGLQFCLDAGDENSYTSGNKFLDVSGNGQDFYLGASATATTSKPTFNGTAGGLSAAEYFSSDGSDCFAYDTTNETYMADLHKDNATAAAIAFYWVPTGNADLYGFGSRNVDPGIFMKLSSLNTGLPTWVARKSGVTIGNFPGEVASTANAWNSSGVVFNEAGGSSASFHYLNGAYNTVAAANTFDGAYSGADTSTAGPFTVGAASNSGGNTVTDPMPNNTRIAAIAFWSGTLPTKANFDTIFAAMRGRFDI